MKAKWLTIREAAVQSGCNRTTIDHAVRAHVLPARRITVFGKYKKQTIHIHAKDLREFVQQRRKINQRAGRATRKGKNV